MVANRKPDYANFAAKLADHKNSSWHFAEMDGTWRTWRDLSPEARLSYIAMDAVADGVSVERFIEAAQDMLGVQSPQAREDAYARLLLYSEHQLQALERLLPDSSDLMAGRESTVERFEELFEAHQPENEPLREARTRAKDASGTKRRKNKGLSVGD